MKLPKILFLIVYISILAIPLSSCKRKCKANPPMVKITNNNSSPVTVQILPATGNGTTISNISPGTSTSLASYTPGNIDFIFTVNSKDTSQIVNVSFCNNYDVAIDNTNKISVTQTQVKYQ